MNENNIILNNKNTINEEINKKNSHLSEGLSLKTTENHIKINSNINKEEVVYSDYITTMKSDNITPFCLCPKSRIYLKSNDCKIGVAILALSIIIITNIFQNVFINKKLTPKTLKLIMIILHNLDTLITIYVFFDVSTTSPGYQEIKEIINFEEFEKIKPFITVNNETFYLKFCQTCKIIRKPRTFHCKYCNKCVLRQDHHCDFVNNCIGRNNYIKFIVFLINVFIYCLLTLIINILFFSSIGLNFSEFNSNEILCCCFNFINLFLAIFFGAQMLYFLISHFEYMCNNITTRETIKKNINEETLNKGCKNNCNIACNKDYVEDLDIKYDEVINNINNRYNNNN